MEWLIYLLCPLMMMFCMKGMFSGGKKHEHTNKNDLHDMDELKIQLSRLTEQNQKLADEVKSLHSSKINS